MSITDTCENWPRFTKSPGKIRIFLRWNGQVAA